MVEQRNSDRFLQAFSDIEHEMARILKLKEHRRFFELIDKSAKVNPVIERYRFDLKEYGELRNAIVHDRAGGEVIAEPNNHTVEHIEHITRLLLKPPGVTPLFLKEVLYLSVDDSISQAIKELGRMSYSQLPVKHKDEIVCLLTSNMIIRWMGKILTEGELDIEHTSLEDVIRIAGKENNYKVVSVNKSLLDIPDLFYNWEQQGKKLEAVLITQNGEVKEPLVGMITNRDLPQVHKALE
ncbi:MAG: CBS domain-containing protein [Bacillota bacterium]